MSLLNQIITALPFHKVTDTYNGSGKEQPFYFQKKQCKRDCLYGTITDREHLPSFIVKVPQTLGVNFDTGIQFEIQCADGSNNTAIIPVYDLTIQAFVSSQAELDNIATQPIPPNIGDIYWYNDGKDVFLQTWDGIKFIASLPNLQDCSLVEVVQEGLIYLFTFDEDCENTNPYLCSEFKLTANGFQLCDIGEETYIIYNGFKIQQLPCGLQQIRIKIPSDSGQYLSELVDIRDINLLDNEYHKLTITNSCNLGGIPYKDVKFIQNYWFDEDTLVGEPEYNVEETKEEDGLGNEKLVFSKVEKRFKLDTKEVPEYIVDFLFFATQHNSIFITFPYQLSHSFDTLNQYVGKREIDSDTITAKNDLITTGCYNTVQLQFALVDDVVKTACCQTLDKKGCVIPSYTILDEVCYDQQDNIEAIPPSLNDAYLIKKLSDCPTCDSGCPEWHDHPEEIAIWNGLGWDYVQPTDDLMVLNNSTGNRMIYITGEGWKILNSVEQTAVTSTSISIKGYILSDTTAYVYYKISGMFTWTFFGKFNQAQLLAGQTITGLVCEENYDIRIRAINNNCDYGYGDTLATGTGACI